MATREQKADKALAEGLKIQDWFVRPGADQLARRHEIWTLLGWYHRTVVQPQLGFAGGWRRLWWQLTGRGYKLRSPWEAIHSRVSLAKLRKLRDRERQELEGTDVTPAPEPPRIELAR